MIFFLKFLSFLAIFLAITFTCSFQVRHSSIYIPRNLVDETCSIAIPSMKSLLPGSSKFC